MVVNTNNFKPVQVVELPLSYTTLNDIKNNGIIDFHGSYEQDGTTMYYSLWFPKEPYMIRGKNAIQPVDLHATSNYYSLGYEKINNDVLTNYKYKFYVFPVIDIGWIYNRYPSLFTAEEISELTGNPVAEQSLYAPYNMISTTGKYTIENTTGYTKKIMELFNPDYIQVTDGGKHYNFMTDCKLNKEQFNITDIDLGFNSDTQELMNLPTYQYYQDNFVGVWDLNRYYNGIIYGNYTGNIGFSVSYYEQNKLMTWIVPNIMSGYNNAYKKYISFRPFGMHITNIYQGNMAVVFVGVEKIE